jgi:alpha-L-rhamnosidase
MRPRLSWKLVASNDVRNQTQSAYRITVSSSEARLRDDVTDVWDSGKVDSARQLHIEYDGRLLSSGERCFWRVQIWDGDGGVSDPSPSCWWEMGLLHQTDWKGGWISDGKAAPATEEALYEDDPAPLYRRSFRIDKPVRRARLYAAGLGYYELRLNGRTVSDRVLDPAWSSFAKRVYYTTHDLTEQLTEGENVLGIMLGNGWYNPLPLRMWGRINIRDHLTIGRPRLIAQIIIDFDDGSSYSISSDGDWRTFDGPILRNSVYLGERYDARLEQRGWDQPSFDDSAWRAATRVDTVEDDREPGELHACPIPPIRITATLSPVSLTEPEPGVFIFDLGQNFAGWAKLRVQGIRGTTVRMRMGELLYPDGTLNPMTSVAGQIKGAAADGTPRGGPGAPDVAYQSNTYTLRGGDMEEYVPRFTFHGFRYVEVTGFPGTPTLASIEGLRLNTDVEAVGSFSCSNQRFNRIHEMVQWTLLSNLLSVQSDCPAREKFQYGGDIVASSEMAIYGYDMARFYAKTISDHRDAVRDDGWFTETAPFVGISAESYAPEAGPIGWGLAHPLLLAQLYQYYGDRRIIAENFGAASTWVDLLEKNAEGYIIDRCIGDHESLDPKPIELIATAQFYQSASLVADFANVLGRIEERDRYRQLAQRIKSAFAERFLESGTGRFGIATQAAQATALHLGLAPANEIAQAVERLLHETLVTHGGHIATGIFGTKYLLNVLAATGNADVAYAVVDKVSFPGWGFMLDNGATTLWETWAQSDNVYSQNHPMFGSVSEWFYRCLGGIYATDGAVGFDRMRIEPGMPAGLEWVETAYESVRGTIRSSWRIEAGTLRFDVEVPVNATAVVKVATSDVASIQEGGRPVHAVESIANEATITNGDVRFELGSGRYSFTAAAP